MGIRPIVSSCNSIIECISQFVDRWLQPHVKKTTLIPERYDRFSQTNRNTQKMLVSIYRCILTLHKYPPRRWKTVYYITYRHIQTHAQPEQPLPEVLAELIEITFKNNVFEFNDYYLQIQGTAMGTKMAPAYANLFMGKLEEKLKELGKPNILLWKQFIDDIFIIWTGSTLEFSVPHT